ncbi:MAG: protein-glutamate O-methyltransferase CheR [Candidatus Edwardsbacteria bacterium]|nr:protein-glutamate O-methyltransferase CheR [Candidatus Edwardsbacteria bacterium]
MTSKENITDPELLALADRILADTGFDIRQYKERPLKRRLAVRLRACKLAAYAEYAARLKDDPSEYPRLWDALTINVTSFYRNPETYAAVQAKVFPVLVAEAKGTGSLLFWSAGCSSGEEPYSIAILWKEYCARHPNNCQARIVATDIDAESLRKAKAGVYARSSFNEIPPELIGKYFTPQGDGFRVAAEIQAMVEFRRAELMDPAPFRGVDLIFCRNALIYFSRAAQETVFERFAAGLRPEGFMVLGKVETLLGQTKERFSNFDIKERIYRLHAR